MSSDGVRKRVLVFGSLRDRGEPCGITNSVYNVVDSELGSHFDIQVISTFRGAGERSLAQRMFYGLFLALSTFLRALISRAAIVDINTASDRDLTKHAAVVLAATAAGAKCIIRIHGGGFARYFASYSPTKRRFVRFLLRLADRVVVLSEGWREQVQEMEPKSKLIVIPNSISARDYVAIASQRDYRRQDILLLANLCAEKGHFDALEACVPVFKRYSAVKLIFAGDEREPGARKALAARAEELGLADRVVFAGPVQDDIKLRTFAESGVFILPSHTENMPLSIMEAMSSGLPVVATRVGAIPEMICDGETGLLIEAHDTGALANQILELLDDEDLRRSMGARASAMACDRWNIERAVQLNCSLYDDLTSR